MNRARGVVRARSGSAVAKVAVLAIGIVALAACVNDFDALFAEPKDGGGSSSSSSSGSSSGKDDDDDVVDEPDGSKDPAPLDPTSACGAKAGKCLEKHGGGFNATTSCDGCGCRCQEFICGSTETCTMECSGGATCEGSCFPDGDCTVNVIASRAQAVTCAPELGDCTLGCTKGSLCDFDCRAAKRCTVSCDEGSQCSGRICIGDGCQVSCPSPQTCGKGLFACGGAPCPK